MLIDIKACTDHTYNGICERAIGRLLTRISGLPAHDFSEGPRSEYDWMLGHLPMELKMSSHFALPVEMSKDREGLIPSGVAVTTAPFVLFITNGHGPKGMDGKSTPVAKVRMFETKWLKREARKVEPTEYVGDTDSQTSYVHYIKTEFHNNDIWLGDMQFVRKEDKWFIDTDTFIPSRYAGGALNTMELEYINGTFN